MSDDDTFDPAWIHAILRASDEVLRDRVHQMMSWAESRINHCDRQLADSRKHSRLNETGVPLYDLAERTALVAVLTQLAGEGS